MCIRDRGSIIVLYIRALLCLRISLDLYVVISAKSLCWPEENHFLLVSGSPFPSSHTVAPKYEEHMTPSIRSFSIIRFCFGRVDRVWFIILVLSTFIEIPTPF